MEEVGPDVFIHKRFFFSSNVLRDLSRLQSYILVLKVFIAAHTLSTILEIPSSVIIHLKNGLVTVGQTSVFLKSTLKFKKPVFQRNLYTGSNKLLVKTEMEGNRADAISIISIVFG